MVTISDSRQRLEGLFRVLMPLVLNQTDGMDVEVDIFENRRKKRSDAAAESWQPYNEGEIRIRFGGAAAASSPSELPEEGPVEREEPGYEDRGEPGYEDDEYYTPQEGIDQYRADLIRSLDRAEQRDGFEFVALKWFRDLFLPAEQHAWVDSQEARSRELRDAIDDRAVLTYKVPNPRAPEFPTTAIRVNRRHPDAVDVLGETWTGIDDYPQAEPRGRSMPYAMRQVRR